MLNPRPKDCQYVSFGEHLHASDIGASEEILADDPIWSFLDHLYRIIYYLPSFGSDPDHFQILHIWSLISKTLCWIQRHQEVGSVNCP